MNIKYFLFILAFAILFGCSQKNELLQKVKQQPLWQLSEITQDGKKIPIKFITNISLYGTNNLYGRFPANGFSGKMDISANGKVYFSKVGVGQKAAQNRERMKEEAKLKGLIFEVSHAKFEGDILVMSNEKQKLQIKYTAVEFDYMKTLQAKTWMLLGTEQKKDMGIAVAYSDARDQYANLKKSKQKMTFVCSVRTKYDNNSGLVYKISGKIGEHSYSANLRISKNKMGKESITNLKIEAKNNVKISQEQQNLLEHLRQMKNFSHMHNNLHILTKNNLELVFKPKK